ncbi:MAG: DUF2142 domain-containing protein [Saccharofermentans sp.]|nr:DUF2142 domain-containing protein [Saccharofermentans sp.]
MSIKMPAWSKIKKINLVITALIGIVLIIAMSLPAKAFYSKNSEFTPYDYMMHLESGNSVTSPLIRTTYGNTIRSVNILLGTNSRINEGDLVVELIKDSEVLETWSLSTEDIPDLNFYVFNTTSVVKFENGSDYSIRVTDYYEGDNGLSVGMSLGNIICSMVKSYNGALASRMHVVLSVFVIAVLAFLCLKTNLLDLPSYKLIIGCVISFIAICIFQFDVLQTTSKDLVVKTNPDISLRQTIEPGEESEFSFVADDSFTSLGFWTYGDNLTEYLVTLVNESTGATYFVNSEINITQRRQLPGVPGIVLNYDASLIPNELFEEGQYSLKIINTSPDVNLDIGLANEGDNSSNATIAVSLVKASFLANYIALGSIVFIVLYLASVYYFRCKNKLNEYSFFIISVIPLSIVYLVLFQPLNVPDAEAHFVSAYHLSNLFLGVSGDKEWMLRACDSLYYNKYDWWNPAPNPSFQHIGYAINHIFDKAGDTSLVVGFPDYSKMKYYSLFNWLPQALGLTIGRLIGANPIITIYLARMLILFVYIFACARAIWNTPVGKFIFCSIALLPTNLMLSSSFSYDCMFLIVSLNFIAIILKLRNRITRGSIIEAIIWAILLGSIKGGGALVLLPLALLIIKKDKKSIITVVSILAASGLAVLLFNKILAPDELFQFGSEGDGNYQAGFALANPIEYLRLSVRSYLISINSYSEQILGSVLSWLESTIPSVIVFIMAGLTILGACFAQDEFELSKKDKALITIPIIISIVSTPAMLLSYTKLGSYMVSGIQGRYFSSIFPLVLLLVAGYVGKITDREGSFMNKMYKLYAPVLGITVYYLLRTYLIR